jgi:nucleotide-binding universal stress UspA family protein
MKIDHILVATDLSPESLRPCAPVSGLARQVGARITLLNVVQDLRVAPHGAPLAPAMSAPDVDRDIHHAKLALEEQRATVDADLDVKLDVVADNDTAQAIVDYAKKHQVDLIALSTHGRTGFRHLALGSVAESVLRRSPVPVVVFPREKE